MTGLNANPQAGVEPAPHVQRRRRLFITPDLSNTRGIEIGPLAMPLIRKSEGDIRYVDCVDQAELKAKYKDDPNVDIESIVEIDGIWGEHTLAECFPGEPPFDYVIASHVIEHVPDMIGWLQEIADVLRPGGCLYLAVPDRRFTFDYYRRTSSLAEFIGAYLCGSRRPTPTQVFDQGAYWCTVDPASAWAKPPNPRDHLNLQTLRQAFQTATAVARQPQYVDVHCWVFTPRSLLETLVALVDLDLLPYRCARFRETPPGELEMALVLEKVHDDDSTDTVCQGYLDQLSRLGSDLPGDRGPSDESTLAAFIASVHAVKAGRDPVSCGEPTPVLSGRLARITAAPRKVGALLRPWRSAAAKAAGKVKGQVMAPCSRDRGSAVADPHTTQAVGQQGRGIKFRYSEDATRFLAGLQGLEIGGGAHNPFGLNTINVDRRTEVENELKQLERTFCGEVLPVDVLAEGDRLPFRDQSVDFVISSHVIEYFYDPVKALREWCRVSRRYVFIICPHKARAGEPDRLAEETTLDEVVHRMNSKGGLAFPAHQTFWTFEGFLNVLEKFLPEDWRRVFSRDPDDKVGNGFTVVYERIGVAGNDDE
jgi:SAM-dependent methyltransferase